MCFGSFYRKVPPRLYLIGSYDGDFRMVLVGFRCSSMSSRVLAAWVAFLWDYSIDIYKKINMCKENKLTIIE